MTLLFDLNSAKLTDAAKAQHHIPLRRIMVPMGYGDTKMLDTSATAAGLAKNRRVEVRVMVNKGLSQQ